MPLIKKILLSLLLWPNLILAQTTGVYWYFNDSLGLRFNNNLVEKMVDGVTATKEGTSVICESDSLVLYTDGITVWDHTHVTIQNGLNLNGSKSSIQSSIILKQPESESYYLFTVDASKDEKSVGNQGVCYSVIDFDPIIKKYKVSAKNISLGVFGNEAITAKHSTNRNWIWIIFPEFNTRNIVVYKLDQNGLSFHSKQSVLPSDHIGKSQIKISPSGNLISLVTCGAGASYEICIFRFNNTTGEISEYGSIKNFVSYGLEFSPNENYLYIQGYSSQPWLDNVNAGLYQVLVDSIKPKSTLTSVNANLLHAKAALAVMSLTPQSQIFLMYSEQGGKAISAILQPDSFGSETVFTTDYIYFNNRSYNASIPNICVDYLLQPYFEIENGCVDSAITLKVHRNRADSITWNLGDGTSFTSKADSFIYSYQNGGEYETLAILHYSSYTDTLKKEMHISTIDKPQLGSDTLLCEGNVISYSIADPLSDLIIWNGMDTASQYVVSSPQKLHVESRNEYCSAFDTVSIDYIDCTITVDSLCFGDSTVFLLQESKIDSASFFFDDGEYKTTEKNYMKYVYDIEGEYYPSVTLFYNGLSKSIVDTIFITRLEDNYLNDSVFICDSITLSPALTFNDYNFQWNTGDISRDLFVNEPGQYRLRISKNNCIFYDTSLVILENCECLVFVPNSFTPNDDNLNDHFSVLSECELKNLSMTVYNRWGEKIIDSTDQWDGTYLGKNCPSGVYLWIVRYIDIREQPVLLKGTVHLMR